MNGNCYFSEGINPTLTCNKNEGNRVAIPVLTPDRANKRQNGRRFKEDGEEAFTLTGQDRHGVAVEVNPEVIGGVGEKNFGKQWRQGNRIYDGEKIATALEAQPVGNTGGNTNLYAVEVTGFNATRNSGGGMTNTALALNARDYKGLSGSSQMMTAAAICLQSTKESDQMNEKLQTASKQEKIEAVKAKAGRNADMFEGVIDDQGRLNKRCHVTDTVPTLRSESHGNQPKAILEVKVKQATSKGYSVARGRDTVNFSMPESETRRGRVGVDMANTLDTSCNQGIFVEISPELTVYAVWYPKKQCYIAIRKLTPKECFRLQGWTDDYFEKAQFVNSDSQLYKQAGNGVTVNVIEAIAKELRG